MSFIHFSSPKVIFRFNFFESLILHLTSNLDFLKTSILFKSFSRKLLPAMLSSVGSWYLLQFFKSMWKLRNLSKKLKVLMIMFLIIVNYGKLWQTFGEGHRDSCQYLANTVMMITCKTFHIQHSALTNNLPDPSLAAHHLGIGRIGSLKTSENNLVT